MCLILSTHVLSGACNCYELTVANPVEVWTQANNQGTSFECIRIKAGQELTIDGLTLEFGCTDGRIYVEPGGKLVLKNCTIGARYNSRTQTFAGFAGIFVKGRADEPQMDYYRYEYDPSASNFTTFRGYRQTQGLLIMQNCTLKNVQKRDPALAVSALESRDGGILELYNNYFENNSTDVLIANYSLQSTETEAPNAFNLINCTFRRWADGKIMGLANYDPHVKLLNCNRVQIEGCHFINNYPREASRSFQDRETGIEVNNASFFVQKSGFSRRVDDLDQTQVGRLDQPLKCPKYNLPFARRNRFENLAYGIECVDGTFCNRPFGVSDCVFYNCHYGISMASSNTSNGLVKVAIARNVWVLDGQHQLPDVRNQSPHDPYFVRLSKYLDVTLSENAGQCSVREIDGTEFGVHFVTLSGFNGNTTAKAEIYRNNVDLVGPDEDPTQTLKGFTCVGERSALDLTSGIRIVEEGGVDISKNQGMYLTCNYFSQIQKPVILVGVPLVKQANLSAANRRDQAANNVFDQCGMPRINLNAKAGNLHYVYYGNEDDPDPNNANSAIVKTTATGPYSCPSLGCSKWPTKYIDPATQLPLVTSQQALFSYQLDHGWLTLVNTTQQPTHIQVVSMEGKVVHRSRLTPGTQRINLTAWPRGVYLLHGSNGNQTSDSEKFLLY